MPELHLTHLQACCSEPEKQRNSAIISSEGLPAEKTDFLKKLGCPNSH